MYDGFGLLADGRPFWTGDFNRDGADEIVFYTPADDNWWIGVFGSAGLRWSLAGNTAGFGHAINDGRPFWTGDFNGDGAQEILFYYPGDDNWWLGTFTGGQFVWTFAGNTAGFGHAIHNDRPWWTGRFVDANRTSILFYYPGDDNWWVGTLDGGGQLQWSLAANTAAFGHAINDGRPFWTGDFDGDGRDEVLFYYPGDDNWWRGAFSGTVMNWSYAGNTAAFGHAINDGRPFWIGKFVNPGQSSVLFYYPGDDNWWIGTLGGGGELQWAFAGNTAGFGHAINEDRPFWIGDFTRDGRDDVLFYYPGDDNWWIGSCAGTTLQWSFGGNTGAFGHAINDGRPFWTGRFAPPGDSIIFYYPPDGNWWRGTVPAANEPLAWSYLGNTGRYWQGGLDLNVIFVGVEGFTDADFGQVSDSLSVMRSIYANVSLGILNVFYWQITNSQAGAATVIDSESEAEDLTHDWTVRNSALDMFVVRSATPFDGVSAVDGPCDKDSKGFTGSVVSLNGDWKNSGNTFAHEVGHYLGLGHIPDKDNFIGNNGDSDSKTGIYGWQGDVMQRHCFVRH